MNEEKTITIPKEFKRLFDDGWREAAVFGGRFSLKSHTVARFLLIKARESKVRIACFREFQNSIAESSHQLLSELISEYGMTDFKVTNNSITNSITGSDFIFKGLWNNEQTIKSIEGIDYAWVEEAQTISQKSLDVLTPTVRKDNSKLIYTFNRLFEDDPIYTRLITEGRPNTLIINVNYDVAVKHGFVPQVILDEIEDDKLNRPNLYKHKWLGEPFGMERRIYNNWNVIDEIPHEARLYRRGLDFGYSCLDGDTLVDTSNGLEKIKNIKVGDYVMTRKGYRRVVWSKNRGIKKVYDIDFGYKRSIIVTGDHRIFTGNGWKRADELTANEIICQKKLNLMERFIGVIRMENILNIFSLLTVKSVFTGRYIKNIMGKFLKVFMSIILMVIRLITIPIILLRYLLSNIIKSIIIILKQDWLLSQNGSLMRYTQNSALGKITGKSAEKKALKQQGIVGQNVKNAVKKYLSPMCIRSFVERSVLKKQTQETARKNIFARIAEQCLKLLHITQEIHALKNVHISSRLLSLEKEVFDISVEGEHEFFANGILVHNCDPSVLEDIYEYNGGYILDERIYQKGLSNKALADMILNFDQPQTLVIADSAEPKSIDEMRSYGVNIIGAKKGQGSVLQGIQYVQGLKISITSSSVKTIKAYRNYMWAMDRNGKILQVPDDTNHEWSNSLSAVRYGFNGFVNPKQEKGFFETHSKLHKPEYLDLGNGRVARPVIKKSVVQFL